MSDEAQTKSDTSAVRQAALKAVKDISLSDVVFGLPHEIYNINNLQKLTAEGKSTMSMYENIGNIVRSLGLAFQLRSDYQRGSATQYTLIRTHTNSSQLAGHTIRHLCKLDPNWKKLVAHIANTTVANIPKLSDGIATSVIRVITAHYFLEHGPDVALQWTWRLNAPVLRAAMAAWLKTPRTIHNTPCHTKGATPAKDALQLRAVQRALVQRRGVRESARVLPIRTLSSAMSRRKKASAPSETKASAPSENPLMRFFGYGKS